MRQMMDLGKGFKTATINLLNMLKDIKFFKA